jgi:hypothetical protein
LLEKYKRSSSSPGPLGIERVTRLNEFHWRHDVTLGEDGCQSRTGKVPQMLAALHNVVLALMEMLAVSNVAAQMCQFAAFPEQALQLLLSGGQN